MSCHSYNYITVVLYTSDYDIKFDDDKLQCALDLITKWTEDWQLSISVSKCNVVTIGKPSVCGKYYFSILNYLLQLRDLGIAITSELSPSDHIQPVSYTHLTLPTNREV